MATSKALNFVPWSAQASALLKPALPGTSRQFIKRQVKRGDAGLVVRDDLAFVLRIEGRELVVVAAAGRGLLPATDLIFNFARENGLSTIRFHTRRKGLHRHVKKWPFTLIESRGDEYIYRMTV
jgi:hypothetical protein